MYVIPAGLVNVVYFIMFCIVSVYLNFIFDVFALMNFDVFCLTPGHP